MIDMNDLLKKFSEVIDNFDEPNTDKLKSLRTLRMLADDIFFKLAFTLDDKGKIELMEMYNYNKSIVANLICKLSNDELKLESMRKFQIKEGFLLEIIINTFETNESKIIALREFDLNERRLKSILYGMDTGQKKI